MLISRRRVLKLGASIVPAAVLSGCLGSSDPEVTVLADGSPVPDATITAPSVTRTAAPLPVTPTPDPNALDPNFLTGFTMPIEGACMPSSDLLMPNAPREYRNGVHEGIDFYFGDSCVVIDRGTPVLAMYDGVITRADHDYVDLTAEELAILEQQTEAQGFTDEETLDIYRGRQVWINHGNDIVTRYCHLEYIEEWVAAGLEVSAGDPIGGIGESGTPESVTAPNTELHLHAEVRIGDSFLGADLPPEDVRALYEQLFLPAASEGETDGGTEGETEDETEGESEA